MVSLRSALLALATACLPALVMASPIVVTSNSDDGSPGTLRWAINEANANTGHDVIEIPAMTITLDGSALPTITQPLTIEGAGPNSTIIQASTTRNDITITHRVITTSSNGDLILRDLQVRHGRVLAATARGGGIQASGPLVMERVTVRDNIAQGQPVVGFGSVSSGGGVFANNELEVRNCWFDGNEVRGNEATRTGGDALGGGLFIFAGGLPDVLIERTAFTNNSAIAGETTDPANFSPGVGTGGGLMAPQTSRTVILSLCTFDGNSAVEGTSGSNPNSGRGGAARLNPDCIVDSCTFTNNTASRVGGAIHSLANGLTIKNSLLAGNTAGIGGPNIGFDSGLTANSLGYNLLDNSSGVGLSGVTTGNQLNVDPELDGLLHRGESVGPVMGLQSTSPAINAGSHLDRDGEPHASDQTGARRIFGPAADIGAFEHRPFPAVVSPPTAQPAANARRSHFVFDTEFNLPLEIAGEDIELIGTYADGYDLHLLHDGDSLRVIVHIDEITESDTIGIRINEVSNPYLDPLAGLPLDSNLVNIRNVPGDIDGDGDVDASELNEVILRFRGLTTP